MATIDTRRRKSGKKLIRYVVEYVRNSDFKEATPEVYTRVHDASSESEVRELLEQIPGGDIVVTSVTSARDYVAFSKQTVKSGELLTELLSLERGEPKAVGGSDDVMTPLSPLEVALITFAKTNNSEAETMASNIGMLLEALPQLIAKTQAATIRPELGLLSDAIQKNFRSGGKQVGTASTANG